MENINSILGNFGGAAFSIPLGQMVLAFGLCLMCLLWGRHKWGLLVSYFFIFYWGFIANRLYWVDLLGGSTFGLFFFVFCGLGLILMGVVSVFQETH